MACGGFVCSRNTLIFLNIIYFIVGIMLIVLAAYCKALAIITTLPVMSGIIACGIFLSIIAVVGVVGAIRHHQVMLFFYMVILFFIFLLQFSVACASLGLTDYQQKSFFKMGWKLASDELRTRTQDMFSCCGMDSDHQFINESNQEYNHPTCHLPQCIVDNSTFPCCLEYKPNQTSSSSPSTTSSPSSLSSSHTSLLPTPSHTVSSSLSPTIPHRIILGSTTCPAIDCWSLVEPKIHQLVRAVGAIGLFFSFTELFAVWLTIRFRNIKRPEFKQTNRNMVDLSL